MYYILYINSNSLTDTQTQTNSLCFFVSEEEKGGKKNPSRIHMKMNVCCIKIRKVVIVVRSYTSD